MSKKTRLFLTAVFGFYSLIAQATPTTLTAYAEDYFAGNWGAGAEIKAQFEQQYPQCQVNYQVFDSSNTMLNRLRLEGKNSPADIVIGIDNFQLLSLQNNELFEPNQVDLSQLQLPFHWKDTRFLPYDFAPFAFIYDKNKLTNPPKSLKELVERQDLRIIYQDPRTSSIGRGFVVWMNTVFDNEHIEQAWHNLAQHTLTIGKGWSSTYGAFLKGEGDLVLSQSTSPIYHLLTEQNDRYAATEFREGALYQIQTAVKISGKNNPCAEPYLQFLLRPQSQALIVEKGVMLSVTSAAVEPHYAALKSQVMQQLSLNSTTLTNDKLKEWIMFWQQRLSQ
ncbi:MAG: thiamine ABC transporter substrate binding subunit [Pasteurellaceae bacterium]|nr:thiamine ABC transporter substrate binding subunit [Pasteurellaceae bacterium]